MLHAAAVAVSSHGVLRCFCEKGLCKVAGCCKAADGAAVPRCERQATNKARWRRVSLLWDAAAEGCKNSEKGRDTPQTVPAI